MQRFGNWTLNKKERTLDYAGGVHYQIPLEDFASSAQILDWLFQIEEKAWASPDDVGNLVCAIVSIFGRGVCGCGFDAPFNVNEVLDTRLEA
jgi:hypothetical protein